MLKPFTSKQLTKSDYSAGSQCHKRLYLLTHRADDKPSPDADLQLRFEQGNQVGQMARLRFEGGILISASGAALNSALQKTKAYLSDLSAPALFEGAIVFEDLLIRVDILKNNFDGSWDLIEVKATGELKNEHLDDLAFQLYVLRGAGVQIRRAMISHINTAVRYPHLNDFFIDRDLTEAALSKLPEIETKVSELRTMLNKSDAPQISIGKQCSNPYGCEFKSQCWADVPKGSVLELYNYRKRSPTKFEVFHRGPRLLKNLTNEISLTPFQQIQVMASQSDEPIVNQEGLQNFLGQVKYPLFYFDFETIAPAVPALNGMRPFQRIPVQFSCHIQRAPGLALEHYEFLASGQGGKDPREECIAAMKDCFDDSGTIVAYHDDFERSLIRELAEAFPEERDFLLALEESFWDLEDAFHHYYYHKDFGGSCSIKKVLPHFEPDMKYDKLAIKNGGQAQAVLTNLFTKALSEFEREKLRRDLLTYCGQDSMAMVVIHQKLLSLTKDKAMGHL